MEQARGAARGMPIRCGIWLRLVSKSRARQSFYETLTLPGPPKPIYPRRSLAEKCDFMMDEMEAIARSGRVESG